MEDLFDGKEVVTGKSSNPLPLDVSFDPINPATVEGNVTSVHPVEQNKEIQPFGVGLQEEPYHAGVIETAKAQFENTSSLANLSDFADRKHQEVSPLDDNVDPNWKPTNDPSIFNGVDLKYKSYLMSASGPKDQQMRFNNIMDWQQRDNLIENGSTLGWLIGGLAGFSPVGSPESLIPIAGQVKYAKFAPTILKTIARQFPGVALGSVAHEAALNTTKVDGNLENFAVDSFADTIFGLGFGGALAGSSRVIDSAALWDMRKTIQPYYHGIDFKPKIDAESKITGYQAVDSTGSLSAAQVSYAQDIANSTFAKTGVFKLPYVGTGAIKLFSVFSPVMRMMNSPYQTVRAFTDRIANHPFITEGIKEGIPAPQKFENLMDQVKGEMRIMSAQMTGLHLVRNGVDISQKPRAVQQSVSYLKDQASKFQNNDYISAGDFHSEIDEAVRSGDASPHAAVNEAAAMVRKQLDTTYAAYREAYNLPETWLAPKTAEGYLMRVYNTPFMLSKQNEWTDVVSGWLKRADDEINIHMEPVTVLKNQVKLATDNHQKLMSDKSVSEDLKEQSFRELKALRKRKTAAQNKLQNSIRENTDLRIHVDDWDALSANEAQQIKKITKKLDDKKKELKAQQAVVSNLTAKEFFIKENPKKAKEAAQHKANLKVEQDNLKKIKDEHDIEEDRIQELMHEGKVPTNLFYKIKDSNRYALKDPKNRLKFRDTYESDHHRQVAARAYYDTIMNQNPEQVVGQVMGRLTGSDKPNSLGNRTLMIPDKEISQFLSKDIVANVSNYKYALSRKTFLKKIFQDINPDGGIEPLIDNLRNEYKSRTDKLNKKLENIENDKERVSLQNKLELENITNEIERASLEKKFEKENIANDKERVSLEKKLEKENKQFKTAQEQMKTVYDKIMGNRHYGKNLEKYSHMLMSYTAAVKLGYVPLSQITDLSANILQHGLWPFIRDGVVPAIESLGGALKTKDSEALRKSAPHVHLALQDVLNGYADKNFGGQAQPYYNMGGKISNGLETIAHVSSNITGTNYIDNGLQHISAAIMQSTIMQAMHDFKAGKLSKKDTTNLLKYGLDPKEWADRFIKEFKAYGAGKTKLGGYQSKFWAWQDLEAANKMSDTIFRGVKDTVIQRGLLDAPFYMDNPLCAILMAFKGWTFASLNRYVIPAMQQTDGQKLIGMAFMLAAGALVSPARRIASGKDPYPDDSTPPQVMWAAVQDSGFFSFFANTISDMNIFTGGTLLGNLRNDRYRDRTMAGLLGPAGGMANDVYNILGSISSREVNQADVNKMVRLIPFTQLLETRALSNKLVENLNIPKTRGEAKRMNS